MQHKILIVTLHYLDGVGGGVFASRAFINAISYIYSNKFEIDLVYPATTEKVACGIDCKIRLIPVIDDSSKLKKCINLLRGHLHRYYNIIPNLLASNQYDIVVFDNSRVSSDMIKIVQSYGAKVITIHHNYEMEYNRDNTEWFLKPLMLFWTRRYEKEAVRESDLNLCLTAEDKQLFIKHYLNNKAFKKKVDNIHVVGTFESSNITHKTLSYNNNDKIKTFVITGNLSAKQTENSVIPWIKHYYPILKTMIPNAKLIIAGKKPSQKLIKICLANNINVIPSPKDMSPILMEAQAYICVTKLGGGLKLRIMDGLSFGLPIIAHTVSARGYGVFINRGMLFSYYNQDSFSKAISEVIKHSFSKEDIQNAYIREFAFESGVKRMQKALNYLD